MLNPFNFNEKAALEAILYIATRSREPTFHRIAKLLYFADRLHLEKFGRLICGDRYIAMKHGPVPSRVYDMLKAVKFGVSYLSFSSAEEAFHIENGYDVVVHREPNLDWLSDSDIECLDEAIAKYDRYSFTELAKKSHDKAWKSADENDFISLEAIVKSLKDPEALLEHLADPHP